MAISIFNIILIFLLFTNALFLVVLSYTNHFKKRKITKYPFISFIVPSYNDSKTIEKSIRGVFDSYDKSNFELFVINDCSKDNTLDILNEIKKKYPIKIINNLKNLGKSQSINNTFSKTKGEIIFIVDSDIVINKIVVDDMISRFNNNPKIGGLSARYESVNKGFLSSMINLQNNLMVVFNTAHNYSSNISMAGGCSAIKRNVFEEVGMLSTNVISEDSDIAMKINEQGYKVEQTLYAVQVYEVTTLKSLYKQQFRWTSGYFQCFFKHWKTYFKNPIFDLFFTIGILSIIASILSYVITRPIIFNFPYHVFVFYSQRFSLTNLFIGFVIYPLFSIPNLLWGIKKWEREYWHFLLIYPFSLIYLPFWIFMIILGFFVGSYKYFTLKEHDVGWKEG